LLIDDGKICLIADPVTGDRIEAACHRVARSRITKGQSARHHAAHSGAHARTAPSDYALSLEIDWLGLSFVQRPDDGAEKLLPGARACSPRSKSPQPSNRSMKSLSFPMR
jgi:pyruvate kinase